MVGDGRRREPGPLVRSLQRIEERPTAQQNNWEGHRSIPVSLAVDSVPRLFPTPRAPPTCELPANGTPFAAWLARSAPRAIPPSGGLSGLGRGPEPFLQWMGLQGRALKLPRPDLPRRSSQLCTESRLLGLFSHPSHRWYSRQYPCQRPTAHLVSLIIHPRGPPLLCQGLRNLIPRTNKPCI